MLSRTIGALTAASLLAASSAAFARPAAPLGVAGGPAIERAGGDLEDASELRGAGRWIVGAIALGLIIWGIIELTGNNEQDFPSSP